MTTNDESLRRWPTRLKFVLTSIGLLIPLAVPLLYFQGALYQSHFATQLGVSSGLMGWSFADTLTAGAMTWLNPGISGFKWLIRLAMLAFLIVVSLVFLATAFESGHLKSSPQVTKTTPPVDPKAVPSSLIKSILGAGFIQLALSTYVVLIAVVFLMVQLSTWTAEEHTRTKLARLALDNWQSRSVHDRYLWRLNSTEPEKVRELACSAEICVFALEGGRMIIPVSQIAQLAMSDPDRPPSE